MSPFQIPRYLHRSVRDNIVYHSQVTKIKSDKEKGQVHVE